MAEAAARATVGPIGPQSGQASPPRQSAGRSPARSHRHCAAIVLALLLGAGLPRVSDCLIEELYTTNSVCTERYCINPVFPALDELPDMEGMRWQKRANSNVSTFMSFCGKFIDYDPAVPLVNMSKEAIGAQTSKLKEDLGKGLPVREYDLHKPSNPMVDATMIMDRAAARRYFTHLAGMGIDPWEHQDPAGESRLPLRHCARSVARLVCFTFFPKANEHIPAGSQTEYLRPCRSSCENYLEACGVECCDESLKCVWDHQNGQGRPRMLEVTGGQTLLVQTGYFDKPGPCEECTGGAAARGVPVVAFLAVLASLAIELKQL